MTYLYRLNIILPLIISTTIAADNTKPEKQPTTRPKSTKPIEEWSFKRYFEKFNIINVFENMKNKTREEKWGELSDEEIEKITESIDPTDELLKFSVDNIEAKNPTTKNPRRYWMPPGYRLDPARPRDAYNIRPRLYNLMKQVIYQSRDKMGIVQLYRERYRADSLYRMGVLISKTDIQCKIFALSVYAQVRHCSAFNRLRFDDSAFIRYALYEVAESEERAINLWFEIDLLTDVIFKNDKVCRRTIRKIQRGLLNDTFIRTWFVDEFHSAVD